MDCEQRRQQSIHDANFQELYDSDTCGPVKKILLVSAVLMVLILLLLFATGVLFQSKPYSETTESVQNEENNKRCMYALLIVIAVLTSMSILLVVLFAIVRGQEQVKLFQPEVLKQYPASLQGSEYHQLKHGGGLLHVNPTAPATARRVYFIHGNSLSLKAYAIPLLGLAALGYSVYALEYSGFGIAKANQKLQAPNCVSVIQDAYDGWEICGSDDAIVIGFSLGGAVLGEIYEFLHPRPAQIVFLNAFCNLGKMISSKMPVMGPVVKQFIRTKWKTKIPCKFEGKVVVVYTRDDDVIPMSQGKQLCNIFSSLEPVCIELPFGGHRKSSLLFADRWNRELLSPLL